MLPGEKAFTLIEVMIAITIFFMAMFAILGVLSSGIHAASILRSNGPTAGMIAAQFYATNRIDEMPTTGDFGEEIPLYQGYRWAAEVIDLTDEGATNLFKLNIIVVDPNGNPGSPLSVLLYKPESGNRNRLGVQQTPR